MKCRVCAIEHLLKPNKNIVYNKNKKQFQTKFIFITV